MTRIELMSKTVDHWKTESTSRKANEPPVLTKEQIRAIEQRIANWSRKNF